ncbi:MAG TPA: ABC transporter substrate-binding protein [Gaiellaceae bacterium]|jgi:branched-chain amino acid transport system substrate-binding protein
MGGTLYVRGGLATEGGKVSTGGSLDRRQLLKRAGAGVAVASIPFAGTSGAWAGISRKTATKPLRIGNLLTLSGPNSAPPIDVRRGFVAYVLAHGHRIGGRRVQFIDADDGNNPATAIRQVQKLVSEDHVDVIEGIFFSSVLLGVRDTIDQLKVPTIVANAAANALSRDRKSAYIFRTSYSNYQLGVPLGPWAARVIGKSGVVAITANYAAGQESAAAFKDAYEKAGGTLGATILTPFPVTPDYQPYFQQAADKGAKGVWAFTAGGGEAIKFVKTYKQFGFDKQFQLFGSNNMTDPQSVLNAQGDAALGIRTTANWAPTLKNKENVLFLKQYDKFGTGEPSAFAELGYIAAQFLDLAVKKVHGDTSNKARFLAAMASVGTWQSPGGKLTMDAKTHNVVEPVYLRNVVKRGSGYTQPLVSTLGVFKEPGA